MKIIKKNKDAKIMVCRVPQTIRQIESDSDSNSNSIWIRFGFVICKSNPNWWNSIRSESNPNRIEWSANKFPFLEICATLCNATFQFSRKQKFPFLEICVTSRDNHGIRIESESNPNRSNSIRDSIESNSNLTQFDSIRFVQNTTVRP